MMKRFLTLYKIEQKLFLRSADMIIFSLCMPVVVLFLIGMIAGGKMVEGSDVTFLQSSYAAICAIGICCSAFMNIPIVMVDYRDKKILKRLYCSPCSPLRLLTVDLICSGVMSVLSVLGVSVVAYLLFGYRMKGNVWFFAGVWFLTMISMFSIGMMVAGLCRTTKALNVATSILYFPMLLFSGATIPFELFPKAMQSVAEYLPLSIGIELMKQVSLGESIGNITQEIVVLILIAVVCSVVAVKTFRWE